MAVWRFLPSCVCGSDESFARGGKGYVAVMTCSAGMCGGDVMFAERCMWQ